MAEEDLLPNASQLEPDEQNNVNNEINEINILVGPLIEQLNAAENDEAVGLVINEAAAAPAENDAASNSTSSTWSSLASDHFAVIPEKSKLDIVKDCIKITLQTAREYAQTANVGLHITGVMLQESITSYLTPLLNNATKFTETQLENFNALFSLERKAKILAGRFENALNKSNQDVTTGKKRAAEEMQNNRVGLMNTIANYVDTMLANGTIIDEVIFNSLTELLELLKDENNMKIILNDNSAGLNESIANLIFYINNPNQGDLNNQINIVKEAIVSVLTPPPPQAQEEAILPPPPPGSADSGGSSKRKTKKHHKKSKRNHKSKKSKSNKKAKRSKRKH